MKNLIKDLHSLSNNNKLSILLLFLLFFIVYAYFIFSWNITIDTELSTYGLGNSEYLLPLDLQFYRLGRPILGLITVILGEVSLPYFSQLIGLGLFFLSSILWFIILQKKKFSSTKIVTFCSLYLVSPIYIFQFSFDNQIIGIGFGFLLNTLAVYYFSLAINSDKNLFRKYITATLYLFLSVGIYQSFLILFLEGAIFLILIEQFQSINFRAFSKGITKIILVSILALIIYYLLCNFIYIFTGKSEYLSNVYNGWEGNDSFYHTIKDLYKYFINILNSPFSYAYITAFILIIFFIRKIPLLITSALIVCLLLPFAMAFALAAPMPFRILFTIPLSLAIVIFSLFKLFSDKKNLFIAFACLALFINFKQICELTYSQNMVQKYNEYNLRYIYSILFEKFGNQLYKTPVVFIASPEVDNNFYIKSIYSQPFYIDSKSDLFGNVFPDQKWQTSNINHRAYYFMRWLGLFYKLPNQSQIELGKKLGKTLKIFPEKGSIVKNDGVIFIKLSKTIE